MSQFSFPLATTVIFLPYSKSPRSQCNGWCMSWPMQKKRPGALDRDCASEKTNTTPIEYLQCEIKNNVFHIKIYPNACSNKHNSQFASKTTPSAKKTIVGFVYISHCLLSFKGSCKSTRMEQKTKNIRINSCIHIYIYTCVYISIHILLS